VATVAATQGCTYLKYRAEDAAEIWEIGFTWTDRSTVAFYSSFESIATLGYGKVDGTFVGWGGGRIGVTPHYAECWGAGVVGRERIGWRTFDKDDPDTLSRQYVGLLGLPLFPFAESRPDYVPA